MFNKSEIISLIVPYAKILHKEYNLLPSVTLSQAILESDWLRHRTGNNVFNLIWHKGCDFDYEIAITHEWFDGVPGPTVCRLKKYNSYKDSFYDYAWIMTNTIRYIPFLNANTYKEACVQLYECGYCSDHEYPSKLISIIEENKLYEYDCVDA
ncbi:glycoside hydrolase family 73 protein [Oceanirhabdus sp. W0125-5]|uniref:glycoside hydrolase family 73 protein n=1 Tax=Oceanirhabdus sp. W0125-5 TaxID=2999116 RepID=UPI0022F2F0B4|nr:glucosaminidase domain-containing protein [Oceanirhabdus sp. W0125-5]WBW97582.1 glucosaminidase domain-containing protein [Oceanirhabdus sp. W0125-5]